ncbi:hypothetical protein E2C01_023451 [Portunus trituberculatus]|uniref:Uncharacterized protein n=1 Tax=Portunus trituberculatus TaxID=210409 RepID=A0A5B7E810_PORTR|nr:hypothetical protein [Portunus trituberculatus]
MLWARANWLHLIMRHTAALGRSGRSRRPERQAAASRPGCEAPPPCCQGHSSPGNAVGRGQGEAGGQVRRGQGGGRVLWAPGNATGRQPDRVGPPLHGTLTTSLHQHVHAAAQHSARLSNTLRRWWKLAGQGTLALLHADPEVAAAVGGGSILLTRLLFIVARGVDTPRPICAPLPLWRGAAARVPPTAAPLPKSGAGTKPYTTPKLCGQTHQTTAIKYFTLPLEKGGAPSPPASRRRDVGQQGGGCGEGEARVVLPLR